MQTFLPCRSFEDSAKVLDNRRLGKQRVECYQILKALTDPDYGWQNHPAVKMWRGYENALVQYGVAMCDEWISRGFKDTTREKILSMEDDTKAHAIPHFIGNKEFHDSHKSNLIRKLPEHYQKLWSDVGDDKPYVWPVLA